MVNNLTFEQKGYGHYKVSGLVNDLVVSFTTSEMNLIDHSRDEDDPEYDHAMEYIEMMLWRAFDNYYNQH